MFPDKKSKTSCQKFNARIQKSIEELLLGKKKKIIWKTGEKILVLWSENILQFCLVKFAFYVSGGPI